jgi:hypothetical protein
MGGFFFGALARIGSGATVIGRQKPIFRGQQASGSANEIVAGKYWLFA